MVQTAENPFGYLTFSVALHVAAAVALVTMAPLELLNEGSGTTIEFTTADDSLGSQYETPVVSPKAENAPQIAEIPEAKDEPKAETPPPVEEAKEAEADVIPTPVPVAKAEAKAEPAEDLTAPVEDESLNSENNAASVAVADEDEKLLEAELDRQVAETKKEEERLLAAANAKEAEAQTSQLAIAPVPVKETKPEVLPEKDPATVAAAPIMKKEVPKKAASPAQTLPDKAVAPQGTSLASNAKPTNVRSKTSAQNYGSKNANKVRSYLDLRQVAGNQPPLYPNAARRSGQQGSVQLVYYVQPNGTVTNLRVVKSSGHALLDQETIRAVSKYKYKAGQAGWTVHPVNYSLAGDAEEMPSRLRVRK